MTSILGQSSNYNNTQNNGNLYYDDLKIGTKNAEHLQFITDNKVRLEVDDDTGDVKITGNLQVLGSTSVEGLDAKNLPLLETFGTLGTTTTALGSLDVDESIYAPLIDVDEFKQSFVELKCDTARITLQLDKINVIVPGTELAPQTYLEVPFTIEPTRTIVLLQTANGVTFNIVAVGGTYNHRFNTGASESLDDTTPYICRNNNGVGYLITTYKGAVTNEISIIQLNKVREQDLRTLLFTGSTGTNEIVFPIVQDNALSVGDANGDFMYFNSNTNNTIFDRDVILNCNTTANPTYSTTINGDLTVDVGSTTNIKGAVINTGSWGHLSTMDQDVTTFADVKFNAVDCGELYRVKVTKPCDTDRISLELGKVNHITAGTLDSSPTYLEIPALTPSREYTQTIILLTVADNVEIRITAAAGVTLYRVYNNNFQTNQPNSVVLNDSNAYICKGNNGTAYSIFTFSNGGVAISELNETRHLDLRGINFSGTTGLNEIVVPDTLSDALSIRDSTLDYIVFNTSTPQVEVKQDLILNAELNVNNSLINGGTVTNTWDTNVVSNDLTFIESDTRFQRASSTNRFVVLVNKQFHYTGFSQLRLQCIVASGNNYLGIGLCSLVVQACSDNGGTYLDPAGAYLTDAHFQTHYTETTNLSYPNNRRANGNATAEADVTFGTRTYTSGDTILITYDAGLLTFFNETTGITVENAFDLNTYATFQTFIANSDGMLQWYATDRNTSVSQVDYRILPLNELQHSNNVEVKHDLKVRGHCDVLGSQNIKGPVICSSDATITGDLTINGARINGGTVTNTWDTNVVSNDLTFIESDTRFQRANSTNRFVVLVNKPFHYTGFSQLRLQCIVATGTSYLGIGLCSLVVQACSDNGGVFIDSSGGYLTDKHFQTHYTSSTKSGDENSRLTSQNATSEAIIAFGSRTYTSGDTILITYDAGLLTFFNETTGLTVENGFDLNTYATFQTFIANSDGMLQWYAVDRNPALSQVDYRILPLNELEHDNNVEVKHDLKVRGQCEVLGNQSILGQLDTNKIAFNGSSGLNEIVVPDTLSDALSIRDSTNDYMVFDTSFPQVEVKQDLALDNITFIGADGFNEIVIPDVQTSALTVRDSSNNFITFNTSTPQVELKQDVLMDGTKTILTRKLDVYSGGTVLDIGDTNATSINIGSTGSTNIITVRDNLFVNGSLNYNVIVKDNLGATPYTVEDGVDVVICASNTAKVDIYLPEIQILNVSRTITVKNRLNSLVNPITIYRTGTTDTIEEAFTSITLPSALSSYTFVSAFEFNKWYII